MSLLQTKKKLDSRTDAANAVVVVIAKVDVTARVVGGRIVANQRQHVVRLRHQRQTANKTRAIEVQNMYGVSFASLHRRRRRR